MIRCQVCNGTGIVKGLGMMERKCMECSGTGWILESNEEQPTGGETKQNIVDAKNSKISTRSEKMKAAWAKRKAGVNDKDA